MAVHVIYRDNATLVALRDLKNAQTKTAITDASPTMTLEDLDGNSLATGSLTHDSGGDYYGTLTPSPAIVETMERGKLTVTIAGSYEAQWEALVDFRNRHI